MGDIVIGSKILDDLMIILSKILRVLAEYKFEVKNKELNQISNIPKLLIIYHFQQIILHCKTADVIRFIPSKITKLLQRLIKSYVLFKLDDQ